MSEDLSVKVAELESKLAEVSEKVLNWMAKYKELEQEHAEVRRSLRMSRLTVEGLRQDLAEANMLVHLGDNKLVGFRVIHSEKGYMPAGLTDSDILNTAAMIKVLLLEDDPAITVTPVYESDVDGEVVLLTPADLYI